MTTIKINEQIAFLRKQKGLTQEELAGVLGITNQAVSKWESAQCCPDIQLLPDTKPHARCLFSIPQRRVGDLYISHSQSFLIVFQNRAQPFHAIHSSAPRTFPP